MSVLTTHRFTVEEYHRMANTGLLEPDARVELLDGQIIDMMPIGPFHGGVNKRLVRLFTQHSKGRWTVAVQDPIHLSDHSEPQPDLMLLQPAPDDYIARHPQPEDVFLLIEVADSTLAYDRGTKLSAYGRAGVKEVWIINLPERTIEVYREPHYLGYAVKEVLREGQEAHLQAFLEIGIAVKALLKQAG